MNFDKKHFDTEGPLGLPMKDAQAVMLDSILKNIPEEDRQLARLITAKKPAELLEGERADVSWITTEEMDRDKEIVISRGMNDSQFRLNPLVTLQHCYYMPPVGRSLWRKRATDGDLIGIKAKTQYAKRPQDWPADQEWQADCTFSLVQAGLMNGKSIGFLRLKSHSPSSHEIAAKPELAAVSRIIDEWLLLEYACVYLPCNQTALVEAVSKGVTSRSFLASLGAPALHEATTPPTTEQAAIPFTTEEEVTATIKRRIEFIDPQVLVNAALDRVRGRI